MAWNLFYLIFMTVGVIFFDVVKDWWSFIYGFAVCLSIKEILDYQSKRK